MAWISSAPRAASSMARVTAVGRPLATSMAKLGPDITAGIASGSSSASTSVMNLPVASSIPLEQRTTGACGLNQPSRRVSVARVCWAGVTQKRASKPARSPRWVVARKAGFRGTPGRKTVFSWRVLMASATSGSSAQRRTDWPSRVSICAMAVPQAPAPITPIFLKCVVMGALWRRPGWGASGASAEELERVGRKRCGAEHKDHVPDKNLPEVLDRLAFPCSVRLGDHSREI